MAAVPFCHGVLDSRLRGNDGGGGRIARMGGMALPSHLAPVVLSELGWAGCRLALLSLWLSEPRITQTSADFADGRSVGHSLGMGWWRWLGLAWCPAVGERGWKGVDDARGFDEGVADALVHGDDVVAGFFEPLVGVVDDAAGFVGFDVVAVDDPFEGFAAVDDVAVVVGRDVAEANGYNSYV